MNTLILIVFAVFVVVSLFLSWRRRVTNMAAVKLKQAIQGKIDPLISQIQSGRSVSQETIDSLARDPVTRSTLFRSLHKIHKSELFPADWRTLPLIAESDLVIWLMHPNELGSPPDEIELVKFVDHVEASPADCYRSFLFRFRRTEQGQKQPSTWIAGVAGPYWSNEEPLSAPLGVFSRFEDLDDRSADEHLAIIEKTVLSTYSTSIKK